MFGVVVTFDLGEAYDAERLEMLARNATAKFQGMPGLVSKTFTLDSEARRAVNWYVWNDEAAARRFFSEAVIDGVTRVYGARPTLRFVAIAARVENPGAA